jgi:hypothetical protein
MVVLRTSKVNYSELSENASPYNEKLSQPGIEGNVGLDTLTDLISFAQNIGIQAGMIGYLNSFILYSLGAIVPMPLLLLIHKYKRAVDE